MASFEHKIIPVSLGFNGVDYSFEVESEKAAQPFSEMEKTGWEFCGFWDKHEIYIYESFEAEKIPFIKLAIFKRKVA